VPPIAQHDFGFGWSTFVEPIELQDERQSSFLLQALVLSTRGRPALLKDGFERQLLLDYQLQGLLLSLELVSAWGFSNFQ
jgi:hypothetical protein